QSLRKFPVTASWMRYTRDIPSTNLTGIKGMAPRSIGGALRGTAYAVSTALRMHRSGCVLRVAVRFVGR
ncbi:MAG: hypothetical protein PHY34_06550, partial [Patescibacteria group bacterium]|nr:hypothetical protein [Patescibacteria group bacterium]